MKAIIAFFAMTAAAQADSVNLNGSSVTLQASIRPGAIAELVFDNRAVNSVADELDYGLRLDDLAVPFGFDWNVNGSGGDDALKVEPPEGITCLPTSCILELPEGDTGTLWLFDAAGVGM